MQREAGADLRSIGLQTSVPCPEQ
ncbi:hypothetical protein A4X09_0g7458, partial [Tilletia walkeri]